MKQDQSPLARWARNGFRVGQDRADAQRTTAKMLDPKDPKNQALAKVIGKKAEIRREKYQGRDVWVVYFDGMPAKGDGGGVLRFTSEAGAQKHAATHRD